MRPTILLMTCLLFFACKPDNKMNQESKMPAMGWASWNHFRTEISEDIIKEQADAMVFLGLKDCGYNFINTDDGFFGGRDENGNILAHPTKFPKGMKSLADYIHSKGLKAGIYSDAGINTCATYWDKDTIGSGMGLFGHDEQDLTLMLKTWGFDFIKIDWCGGDWLNMDAEMRYTQISKLIYKIKPNTIFNVCRWAYPGNWVTRIANSWRISGDVANDFNSILSIIDKNADLWRSSSLGHVNDMDMLQVGRGMSFDEDKTHFSMWCIMNSPLILGTDLRTISNQTLKIIKNKELIAINQNSYGYQGRRLIDNGDLELWAKPLTSSISGKVAVCLLNRSNEKATMKFSLSDVAINSKSKYTVRDLWKKQDLSINNTDSLSFEIPKHGVVVLKITGKAIPINIFNFK